MRAELPHCQTVFGGTPRELPLEGQTLLHERKSHKELGHSAVLTLGTLA